ncbi:MULTISPECIES: alpha/beta fold hydrolase [Streptomyces]|uniref:Alpha/beta hydrolase n=1 Tax=Streptomyces caniscabiei TaxID=2746961 RepID=A0ABU4N593_9ACTN|nr:MULTISPECIES: alpha/beta hydrolase [Streptomyces]MBE4740977.1 alpha/beta fold hydrolase [Streptomyces caniscabiei]MBE4759934.1 alpha/beta fold hydrolase [Streptomyces caniscabiei]MBE4774045.1 alpha/beta fold hydrolase [Streptomyces caniscabiei]MBE4789269.1 alpha/beta fold hydrolase [Streptomyces caniscabiei]MBE4794541.1 alpha/beta fold hydrolase [Streptomyces caniscabiei]
MSRPPSFTPPPGARAHRLRTPRGEFAVIEAGVAVKGSVLLVPGFTGSKEDFIALHEPLAAAGYRTVAVDGRGQYESPGAENDEAPYAQAELAQDLLAQAQAVGDGGPLHLVGHSLGGQISRAAVLRDASPFASLTLMASGPAEISAGQQERVKLLRDALAVMDMEQVWDAIQAMEAPEPEEADTGALDAGLDDRDDLRRRWLATQPAQLIATGRQLCAEPDRVAELAAVGLPKHVISGERDDTWPIPVLDDMAVRLRAHRTVVRGAEHSPNTDQPQATADALIGFWDRLGR